MWRKSSAATAAAAACLYCGNLFFFDFNCCCWFFAVFCCRNFVSISVVALYGFHQFSIWSCTLCCLSSTCEMITSIYTKWSDYTICFAHARNRHLFDDPTHRNARTLSNVANGTQLFISTALKIIHKQWRSVHNINWSRWKMVFFLLSFAMNERMNKKTQTELCTHILIDHLATDHFHFRMVPNKKCDIWHKKRYLHTLTCLRW